MNHFYRYKIIIEYVGTAFSGWQRQENVISIQQVLEEAISKITKCNVNLYVAGRTDAGVHAYAQVAHFDLPYDLPINQICKETHCYQFMHSINHFVKPHKIGVRSCEIVSNDFHARFTAKSRHYIYKIINRSSVVVINSDMKYWVRDTLDIEAMIKASKYLIGRHDFNAFRASQCQAKSSIRTIDVISIKKMKDDIQIFISAKSFLHSMVRNIVGTIILVGNGKLQVDDVKHILLSRDRTKAGPCAPAKGLYLLKVDY